MRIAGCPAITWWQAVSDPRGQVLDGAPPGHPPGLLILQQLPHRIELGLGEIDGGAGCYSHQAAHVVRAPKSLEPALGRTSEPIRRPVHRHGDGRRAEPGPSSHASPPAAWHAASPPAAAIEPSPAPAWTSCSPATGTACANGSCGGCSTRPPPAPGNSSPLTSRTSTRSTGVAASPPRAARSSTSTGPPASPASCPGCYAVAPQGRCSSAAGARPCPVREPLPRRTSARRPDAAGCPTRAPSTFSRGHRRPRPAQAGLDAPPAPPLGAPAPGRRRTHRPRTPGQIPASAPGQPRPVRPARRTGLRPGHR